MAHTHNVSAPKRRTPRCPTNKMSHLKIPNTVKMLNLSNYTFKIGEISIKKCILNHFD
ncbi:unnamed protein product [Meloidogyne enterolobii]|uniref:Uncharacterized protein n=1 Tax=Meloidogyne enterolobii TaxID=390850 RepID=A0ACB0ZQM2_MELEN